MSLFWKFTHPRVPRNAFIIDADELAAVELQRSGGQFALLAASRSGVPEGALNPAFDQRNIVDQDVLAAAMQSVAESAGLGRKQRWSVLLPEGAVRMQTISLDAIPSSRSELKETVAWKVSRLVGAQPENLRVSFHLVTAGNSPKLLTVAVRIDVLAEYERLFKTLGWKVGLSAPRFVGEASWFEWEKGAGDKLVVAVRGSTCLAAFARDGELLLVRSIEGASDRLFDEIYRLSLYYRDRISPNPDQAAIASVLTLGPIGHEDIRSAVGDALGSAPQVVDIVPRFLQSSDPELQNMTAVLAAAGLATQAWSHS